MSASPAGLSAPRADPPLLPQAVMEYLQQHGFDKALQTFEAELKGMGGTVPATAADGARPAGAAAGATAGADADAADDAANANREAIFRAPAPLPLENMVKRNIPQASTMSASAAPDVVTPEFVAQAKYIIDQLQARLEATGENGQDTAAPGHAAAFIDSSDRVEGYKRYRRWAGDSLDLWKPELDLLSFPLFAHTFLDLLDFGFAAAARHFFSEHCEVHRTLHPTEIAALSSITMVHQIVLNPFAQRLRSQRYTLPMSRNAFALLMQWLSGAGLDEEWELGLHGVPGRAKEAVRAIVNSRLDIRVSSMPLDTVAVAAASGLLASHLPNGVSAEKLAATHPLKLGPIPMHEKLKEDVTRLIREEDEGPAGGDSAAPNGANGHDADGDADMASPAPPRSPAVKMEPEGDEARDRELEKERDVDKDAAAAAADLVSPDPSETLPPQPNFYKVIDVKREIEAIRDKRKAVRLGPVEDGKAGPSSMVLPSIVAFTMFDHAEGVTSVEFSADSSLVAAGSAESSIRIWSLKQEKLKAKRVDPLSGELVEDEGQPMRKLIGHSGPVYGLSFDPIAGSAGPPHALLSSSQDGTVRLWSTDTYSNLVIYRGHGRDPVWDVEWGPLGVYFASASRDRTARLWSSERVAPVRMYTGHLSDVNCIKFHPNSMYLASGSSDNSCRLWDVQRGGCVRLFLGHTDAVTTLAISPDGRTLASAGLDSSIYLWDLGSARPIKKMLGHTAPISSLSFSVESSVLVSGGLDGTVRCWDVKSAGGARTQRAAIDFAEANRRVSANGVDMAGGDAGQLPMAPGEMSWESGQTADLLATYHTKRTPVIKTQYTPRNLCMVAGTFVPPAPVRA